LSLQPVSWDHVDLLFEWANDPIVRSMAFSSAPIPRADHERWLRTRLNHQPGLHWIASLDGQPIGQVRFDACDDDYEISVSLAERARGRRLAAPLIIAGGRALVSATGDGTVIHAQVKSSNRASLAAFETARYAVVGHRTEPSASAEENSVVQLRRSDDLSPR
jgi:RimJ/RimL family protein N-acetyltransferase